MAKEKEEEIQNKRAQEKKIERQMARNKRNRSVIFRFIITVLVFFLIYKWLF
jgi:hypothetical protein